MPTATPIPVRASVRDLLTDLLGCTAKVVDAPGHPLSAERPALCAVYRRDDGSPGALAVSDQDFAVRTAAAIGMVPLAEAMPTDAARGPEGDVYDGFHEVVNVLAKLLNSPTTPHVTLGELVPLPGKVPADVAALLLNPGQRSDYRVSLDGYGDGVISLLGS